LKTHLPGTISNGSSFLFPPILDGGLDDTD